MPSIALFGAAGAIGQSLATALRQQGRAYRVVGRNAASLRQTFGADPLAEIVPGTRTAPAPSRLPPTAWTRWSTWWA